VKGTDTEKTADTERAKPGFRRAWIWAAAGTVLCVILLLCLFLSGRIEEGVRSDPNEADILSESIREVLPASAVISETGKEEQESIVLQGGKEEPGSPALQADTDGKNDRFEILPDWINWKEKKIVLSTDVDGNEERTAVLSGKKTTIGQWESPEGCLVQDMLVCDIDSDGEEELMLLLWKIGTNVDLKLWNEVPEEKWGQHIYIFDILEDAVKPIWWASDIALLAESWEFNEKRRLIIHELSGKESYWDWDSFGLKPRPYVSFLVTGDLMIHKAIYKRGLLSEGGFSFLFDRIRPDLEETDVSICLEESVLVNGSEDYSSYPCFGSPAAVGEEIIRSGFDAVALATNHMLDKGAEAVDFTAELYEKNQVMVLGVQPSSGAGVESYRILERQGIRFALFNYTFSTNGYPVPEACPNMIHTLFDEEKVRNELEQGKKNSDFVIVIVHWGTEYDREIDEFQKKWADVFLDCGVGVVIGSHPHVLQKMELIKRDGKTMLCYYSLGNLISTMDREECQTGGLAKFNIISTTDGCRLAGYELKKIDSSF